MDREYERRLVFLACKMHVLVSSLNADIAYDDAKRIELATCGSINTVDNQEDLLSIFFIKGANRNVDSIHNCCSHTDIWG